MSKTYSVMCIGFCSFAVLKKLVNEENQDGRGTE